MTAPSWSRRSFRDSDRPCRRSIPPSPCAHACSNRWARERRLDRRPRVRSRGSSRRRRLSRSRRVSRFTPGSSGAASRCSKRELRDTRARADAADQRMAEVQRTAAGAQNAVAVLIAPDAARVDLAGQPAAPQASARAFWSRSRGMVFTAVEPAAASRRAHVSTVGGDGTGAPQRRTVDARRPGQRERDVQHTARHSPAGRHGRHDRTGRRCAGTDRRTLSRRNALGAS